MPASNVATYAMAFQTAKGVPATAPQFRFNVTDADLSPTVDTAQREETGLGRDVGDTYITLLAAGGGATVLARPTTMGAFAYAVFGAKAVTGAAAPFTHANTPADDQPWVTVWREVMAGPNRIVERFDDCKFSEMVLAGEAGQDITCALTIMGLGFRKLPDNTSIPAGGVHDQNEIPFRYPGITPTIGGATNDRLTGFQYTMTANQTPIQTTGITNSYLEPSQREIGLSYDAVYQNLVEYTGPLYNADNTPRTEIQAVAVTLATEGNRADGSQLTIAIPRLLVTPSQINPDTGGDPTMIAVEGMAGRPASGPISTVTVKNSVPSYGVAA